MITGLDDDNCRANDPKSYSTRLVSGLKRPKLPAEFPVGGGGVGDGEGGVGVGGGVGTGTGVGGGVGTGTGDGGGVGPGTGDGGGVGPGTGVGGGVGEGVGVGIGDGGGVGTGVGEGFDGPFPPVAPLPLELFPGVTAETRTSVAVMGISGPRLPDGLLVPLFPSGVSFPPFKPSPSVEPPTSCGLVDAL